jgi:hypothetical protein
MSDVDESDEDEDIVQTKGRKHRQCEEINSDSGIEKEIKDGMNVFYRDKSRNC